jgi:two-component system sensor histidine kinase GlrK
METVINNLVSNAIRYSPEGGRIDILAERLKDETQITICDQGPGIPADDRAYIFEPFYQGKNQIPGLIQGSGLGLAIARAHIETHGGKLTLIEEISTGTCFQISLPIDIEIADDEC